MFYFADQKIYKLKSKIKYKQVEILSKSAERNGIKVEWLCVGMDLDIPHSYTQRWKSLDLDGRNIFRRVLE